MYIYTHLCYQEHLIAELLANPLPSPPEPLTVDQTVAVPPHIVDGTEITIHDLMVSDDGRPLKDKDLNEWLDAREQMGFDKMRDSEATGIAKVDPATIRTLAAKYSENPVKVKCCGNAITRSCAFTGSFVILKCGRRVLYPECPGK